MNYSSQASASSWEKAGIGKDSEMVYIRNNVEKFKGFFNKDEGAIRIENRQQIRKGWFYQFMEEIGPAMVSDEMEDYLWSKGLTIVRSADGGYDLNISFEWGVDLEAKTLTDAYEQAINWSLDQKEGQ